MTTIRVDVLKAVDQLCYYRADVDQTRQRIHDLLQAGYHDEDMHGTFKLFQDKQQAYLTALRDVDRDRAPDWPDKLMEHIEHLKESTMRVVSTPRSHSVYKDIKRQKDLASLLVEMRTCYDLLHGYKYTRLGLMVDTVNVQAEIRWHSTPVDESKVEEVIEDQQETERVVIDEPY